MRRVARLAAGLLAAAVTAAAPADASVGSRVAAGPNGSAQFLWPQAGASGFNQLHERSMAADATLSDAQSVSALYREVDARWSSVGSDAAGNAVTAWLQREGADHVAYTRRRAADGSLGPLQRLTPAGAQIHDLRLAVEPDGDAVYVWERRYDDRSLVQARRRAADGTLGPVLTLSYAAAYAFFPDVDVAPDGTAVVAWVRTTSGVPNRYMQVRTIAADGSMTGVQNLSTPLPALYRPQVHVSDTGAAVIVWQRPTGDGSEGGDNRVEVVSRIRQPSGALGVTQPVSGPAADTFALKTAGDGAGRTAYVWSEVDADKVHFHLKGRIRQANGGLGPVFDVVDGFADNPQVALDPAGNATFAWNAGGDIPIVQARRRTLAGTLGPVRTLAGSETETPGKPHLAVDGSGKATIAYGGATAADPIYARTVTPGGTVSPARRINGDG